MDRELARSAHTIFTQAVEVAEDERAAFIATACRDDSRLQARVHDLVAAIDRSGDFLEKPALGRARPMDGSTPPLQVERIGAYRIVRVLGVGGMATVYEAIQEQPRREVALKVLRHGLAKTSAIHRFHFETEVLARLQHPGIAQIFEAGMWKGEDGVATPFFALEYVRDALTITAYAQRHGLALPERLRMFVDVCDAVHHGHQVGVIHRDLKPPNILVDTAGRTKVIDFGVARPSAPGQAWITSSLDHSQIIGTLNYMSPEQCSGDRVVDIRTDVYSLGLIIYELVAGRLPLDLSDVPIPVALRRVEEAVRPRPSNWNPAVRGDIDAIVMRAIDIDPQCRYPTVSELAADVRRHLADEPVEARSALSPSGWYALRKTLRKHRRVVGVATAIVVLIAASAVALGYLYREQVKAYQVAERRRADAEWQSYVASVMAAHGALEANDVPTYLRWLQQAPPELRGWEWRYLEARGDGSAATLRGHSAAVRSVAFAPDGTWFLSAGEDRRIRVWDSQYRELGQAAGYFAHLGSIALSPDGSRIAAITSDYRLAVLDARTLDPLLRVGAVSNKFSTVAFSPNGELIATGEFRDVARVWDASDGRELFSLDGESGVTFVTFGPSGKRAAVGYRRTGLVIWDLERRAALTTIGGPRTVLSAAFSPDGTRIATAQDETAAIVWDVASGDEVLELRADAGAAISLAWDPSGRYIATGLRDRTVRLWDARSGDLVRTLLGHLGRVYDVRFSPDGQRLISASRDQSLKVWLVDAPEDITVLRGHHDWVTDVAFSPDGRRMATSSRDATIRIWDRITGKELKTLKVHDQPVANVVFSPDGRRLISCGQEKVIVISDVDSGEALLRLTGHTDSVARLAVSSDGRLIASGGPDRTIRLWDAHSGAEIAQLPGHRASITSLSFSPRGDRLVSTANDGTARIWKFDHASGAGMRECIVLEEHENDVAAAIFDPSGEHVITASYDTVRFWRAADGKLLRSIKVDPVPTGALAMTPDGTRLAVAVDDGVKLIDVASGDEVLTLRGHASTVTQVAFSPDGEHLAAGSWDHTARIWHACKVQP